MKQLFVLTFCVVQYSASYAQSVAPAVPTAPIPEHVGYSYFALGIERFQYQESASTINVKSSVLVTNPVLMTGGLFNINERWDFSIDATSSLFAGASTERWDINSGQGIQFSNGTTLTSANNPIQEIQFTETRSSTQVLSHYKLSPAWRVLAGVDYSLSTFKRYGAKTNYPTVVTVPVGVVEESTGILDMDVGMQYQSSTNLSTPFRYLAALTLNLPIYRKSINSNYTDITFNSTSGWGISATTALSYKVYQKIHLGLYGGYDYRYLASQTKMSGTTSVELPKNTTSHLIGGLTLVYDL